MSTTSSISCVVIASHGKPFSGSGLLDEESALSHSRNGTMRSRPAWTIWRMYGQPASRTCSPSSRQNGIDSSESMCA